MDDRRWWDAAILGALLVIAVVAFIVGPDASPARAAVGLGAVALLVAGYVLLARPRLGRPGPGWRLPAFTALAVLALVGAIIANPFFGMLQAVVYPIVWGIAARRRGALTASAAVGAATFAGYVAAGGGDSAALTTGLVTAGFSLAFAVVFGLWMAGMAEYAEERGRLLAELTQAHAKVESLSRQRGVAEERERLAREIHDTLAQTLAGLVILAERAGRQSRDGLADAAAETIRTVEDAARDALGEARALVARTAAVPADAAFEESLERLVARFRGETGLSIDLAMTGGLSVLGREAQVVLLRSLQETLANVRKHAGAVHVAVSVAVEPDGAARLDVRDDGRGFDPGRSRTGFGLDGMVDRLALAGGTVQVVSAPGEGTLVEVRLPGPAVPA
jgi:signal transduction histidine kinase